MNRVYRYEARLTAISFKFNYMDTFNYLDKVSYPISLR